MTTTADELVDLSANENVLGPSPLAIAAAREELLRIHRYPERQSQRLVERLADACEVGSEQVLLGNGAQHVLRVIAATYLRIHDIAIGLMPTYPGYLNATQVMHATYQTVDAVSGGYNVAAWTQAAADARLIWLCTPNNPTGRVLMHEDAARIVGCLPAGATAVLDETYRDFVDDPAAADGLLLVRSRAPVISVRTFSKLYGLAGLRLGYAVAQPATVAALLDRLDAFPANRVAQAAALAALGDRRHQQHTRRYVLEGRRQLEEGLQRLDVEFLPSQANFVTARFGDHSKRVIATARQAGYVLRTMDGSWQMPGWIRITIGLPQHIRDVLAAIATALSGVGSV